MEALSLAILALMFIILFKAAHQFVFFLGGLAVAVGLVELAQSHYPEEPVIAILGGIAGFIAGLLGTAMTAGFLRGRALKYGSGIGAKTAFGFYLLLVSGPAAVFGGGLAAAPMSYVEANDVGVTIIKWTLFLIGAVSTGYVAFRRFDRVITSGS